MGIRTKSTLAGLAILAITACSSGNGTESANTAAPTESTAMESADPMESATSAGPTESTSAEPTPDSSESQRTTAQDADLAEVDFNTDAQAAIDKSADEVGDGVVHALEIDWDEDYSAWVWSVKTLVGTTDFKVKIDADTGEILKKESDDTDDKEEAIDLNSPMTPEDAQQKALAEQDGAIRSWKLEWDDGRREYQFDIGDIDDTVEVTVDVESGNVTLD